MWWRKSPNERIDKLLIVLGEFEHNFKQLEFAVEILEQKFKSRLFKKKLDDDHKEEVEPIETVKYNDGFDELRKLNKDG